MERRSPRFENKNLSESPSPNIGIPASLGMQQRPEDHTDESEMWREQFTKLLQDLQDQKANEMPQKKLPFAKKVLKPKFLFFS